MSSQRALAIALCVWASCACAGRAGPRVARLQDLVDAETVSAALRPRAALEARFETVAGIESFAAEYPFAKSNPREHYVVLVSLAPVGRLLDPTSYAEAKARCTSADKSAEFPDIGLRAERQVSAGPGGAMYGITFTTHDGQRDISVAVSNLLPEGVKEPDFDVQAFARLIEARYDRLMQHSRQRHLPRPDEEGL